MSDCRVAAKRPLVGGEGGGWRIRAASGDKAGAGRVPCHHAEGGGVGGGDR